jgi:hypothetical protein
LIGRSRRIPSVAVDKFIEHKLAETANG